MKSRKIKKDIPDQLNYGGAIRFTDIHKTGLIKLMPAPIQDIMLKENEYSRVKEKTHSILLTPHPEKYT